MAMALLINEIRFSSVSDCGRTETTMGFLKQENFRPYQLSE